MRTCANSSTREARVFLEPLVRQLVLFVTRHIALGRLFPPIGGVVGHVRHDVAVIQRRARLGRVETLHGLDRVGEQLLLRIAQRGFRTLERQRRVARVARHALLHPGDLHRGDADDRQDQQDQQARDEDRATLRVSGCHGSLHGVRFRSDAVVLNTVRTKRSAGVLTVLPSIVKVCARLDGAVLFHRAHEHRNARAGDAIPVDAGRIARDVTIGKSVAGGVLAVRDLEALDALDQLDRIAVVDDSPQ